MRELLHLYLDIPCDGWWGLHTRIAQLKAMKYLPLFLSSVDVCIRILVGLYRKFSQLECADYPEVNDVGLCNTHPHMEHLLTQHHRTQQRIHHIQNALTVLRHQDVVVSYVVPHIPCSIPAPSCGTRLDVHHGVLIEARGHHAPQQRVHFQEETVLRGLCVGCSHGTVLLSCNGQCLVDSHVLSCTGTFQHLLHPGPPAISDSFVQEALRYMGKVTLCGFIFKPSMAMQKDIALAWRGLYYVQLLQPVASSMDQLWWAMMPPQEETVIVIHGMVVTVEGCALRTLAPQGIPDTVSSLQELEKEMLLQGMPKGTFYFQDLPLKPSHVTCSLKDIPRGVIRYVTAQGGPHHSNSRYFQEMVVEAMHRIQQVVAPMWILAHDPSCSIPSTAVFHQPAPVEGDLQLVVLEDPIPAILRPYFPVLGEESKAGFLDDKLLGRPTSSWWTMLLHLTPHLMHPIMNLVEQRQISEKHSLDLSWEQLRSKSLKMFLGIRVTTSNKRRKNPSVHPCMLCGTVDDLAPEHGHHWVHTSCLRKWDVRQHDLSCDMYHLDDHCDHCARCSRPFYEHETSSILFDTLRLYMYNMGDKVSPILTIQDVFHGKEQHAYMGQLSTLFDNAATVHGVVSTWKKATRQVVTMEQSITRMTEAQDGSVRRETARQSRTVEEIGPPCPDLQRNLHHSMLAMDRRIEILTVLQKVLPPWTEINDLLLRS